MIRIRNLRVRFGGTQALHLDHADLEKPDRVGVVGPNGCGKSTLLRLLSGFVEPTEGEVSGRGEAGRIVLVHQEPYFFRTTVRNNFVLALKSTGRPADEADEWLDRFDGLSLSDRSGHTLSVGERRRLAVARGLAVRPDVLLLDEPFAGLDPLHRELIRTRLQAFPGLLVVASPLPDGLSCNRNIRLGPNQ